MKKFTIISTIFFSLIVGLIFCSDKGSNPGPGPVGKTAVGIWEEVFPAQPPIIPNDLIIRIVIKDTDSTMLFTIVEDGSTQDDTLYKHRGSWEIKNNGGTVDSLYFYGEECYKLDTTANPDTLMPLPDTICVQTIVFDTTGTTGDQWVINGAAFTPFMEPLLDPFIIGILANMDFYMDREPSIEVE